MALIKCPECGNNVSSLANECPKCGVEINRKQPTYNVNNKRKTHNEDGDENTIVIKMIIPICLLAIITISWLFNDPFSHISIYRIKEILLIVSLWLTFFTNYLKNKTLFWVNLGVIGLAFILSFNNFTFYIYNMNIYVAALYFMTSYNIIKKE